MFSDLLIWGSSVRILAIIRLATEQDIGISRAVPLRELVGVSRQIFCAWHDVWK